MTHIIKGHGAMRKVAQLHRITEVDEACAEECAFLHPHDWRNNQGDPIPKSPRPLKSEPIKTVEQEHPWRMGLLYVVGVFAGVGGSYFFARWFQ